MTTITVDEQFVVIWEDGYIIYRFPASEFSEVELDNIREKKFCTGCIRLPDGGFNDKFKKNWCSFSRKIASLQSVPDYVVHYPYYKRLMQRAVRLSPIPEGEY